MNLWKALDCTLILHKDILLLTCNVIDLFAQKWVIFIHTIKCMQCNRRKVNKVENAWTTLWNMLLVYYSICLSFRRQWGKTGLGPYLLSISSCQITSKTSLACHRLCICPNRLQSGLAKGCFDINNICNLALMFCIYVLCFVVTCYIM